MKKYIIYIPTGLYTPEFEIMLSKAQLLIDEKKDVEIITCGGGNGKKIYATSKNIFSLKSIDAMCKFQRLKGFSMLKGDFKLTYTPPLVDYRSIYNKYKFKDRRKINNIFVDGIDLGSSALSSYINQTRDADLDGLLVKKTMQNLFNTSLNLYYFFKQKINKQHHIYLFNGRNNEYRPLLRLATKKKIKVSVIEFSGDGESNKGIRDFKDQLAQDPNTIKREVNRHWKTSTKTNKCDHYFLYIKAGRVVNDKASYVLKQKKNLLPKGWDKNKRNIVYFTSSQDEYSALGGVFDKTIYKDQNTSIKMIIKSLKKINNKNICLWIRCHPNLEKVFWNYNSDVFKFHDPDNRIYVVKPSSKVSSYTMLENCEKIINYASRTGIEAVYWRKPSIIVGRAIFDQLGGTYNPKTHKQAVKLIVDSKLKPKSMLIPIKYASFWVEGGFKYKYMTGSMRYGYKFKRKSLGLSGNKKIIYLFGKFLEYYVYNFIINYKFSFLKKFFK